MPFYNGEKWACYSCTKGHRSSKCAHLDRILYKVRKPGRPLNNCPHVLPETIQPGTFVNTSSESMANGNPPKEACNCKNELVQVAIPKVKNCSCITSVPPGTIKPPQTAANGDTNGVKSGRVMKKQQLHRRRKSTAPDDLFDVAGAMDEGEEATADPKPEPTNGKYELSPLPLDMGHPAVFSPNGTYAQPVIAVDHMQHQMSSDGLQSPWPMDANGSTAHRTGEQTSATNHIQSLHQHPKLNLPNSVLPIGAGHQNLAYPPHARTPRNSIYSPLSSLSAMENPDFFNAFDKPSIPSQPVVITSFQENGSTNTTPSQEIIMAPLTHHEYMWIKHARESGVDFTQLPKFLPDAAAAAADPRIRFSMPFPKNHPNGSPATSPVFSSPPPPTRPVAAGCCGRAAPPPPPPASESAPSSPRCKCGEACRCVPCADHPFNPAMMETIKGGMQLIQEQKPSPPGGSGFEDVENADVSADFRDFVFYNYPYAECSVGHGDCKCGEGCACVGCLTHGGHDGVELGVGGVGGV